MFGPADNRIAPDDRERVYTLLGFGGHAGARSIPSSLNLAALSGVERLRELHARASEEFQRRPRHGMLRGLTEYRVGVELTSGQTGLRLTDVKRGRPNHGGRELDQARTIVGTIHTHPWDVAQSIADVRNLLRSNDVLGGVVTYSGRVTLLIKHPDRPDADRSPFAAEIALQRASLGAAPELFRNIGAIGALSASFDLPIGATRDPYIRSLCGRLGLLYYAGDVDGPPLQRA